MVRLVRHFPFTMVTPSINNLTGNLQLQFQGKSQLERTMTSLCTMYTIIYTICAKKDKKMLFINGPFRKVNLMKSYVNSFFISLALAAKRKHKGDFASKTESKKLNKISNFKFVTNLKVLTNSENTRHYEPIILLLCMTTSETGLLFGAHSR